MSDKLSSKQAAKEHIDAIKRDYVVEPRLGDLALPALTIRPIDLSHAYQMDDGHRKSPRSPI